MKEQTQMLIDAIKKTQKDTSERVTHTDWCVGRNQGYDEACDDILELIKGILS